MNAIVSTALIGVAAFAASSAEAQSIQNERLTSIVRERMEHAISATNTPPIFRFPETIEPSAGQLQSGFIGRYYGCACKSGHFTTYLPEPRSSKLPATPALLVTDSYLKCRIIKVGIIEPRVVLTDYPPGYFGAFEYAGMLVSDWLEFSEESTLNQLFGLVLEVIEESPKVTDWDDDLFTDFDDTLTLGDYRKSSGFTPELLLEFIGSKPLRLEISPTTQRLLIQADDRWGVFILDQWSATALKTLITTEQSKRLQTLARLQSQGSS